MQNTEIRNKVLAVVRELDKLEVRGKNNMTVVLSCQTFLEQLANDVIE